MMVQKMMKIMHSYGRLKSPRRQGKDVMMLMMMMNMVIMTTMMITTMMIMTMMMMTVIIYELTSWITLRVINMVEMKMRY